MFSVTIQLLHNLSWLLLLGVAHEMSHIVSVHIKKYMPYINGAFAGLIGIAVMSAPFQLIPGLQFDTRTILISVTALVFGPIPSVIASIVSIAFRIYLGGVGLLPGILTILSSNVIGLLCRRFCSKGAKHEWFRLYLFGLIVHIVMQACWLVMPWDIALETLKTIAMPVLLIYPVATMFIGMLLIHQKKWHESLIHAAETEERYRSLFENNHTVMLLTDPGEGHIVDANPAACAFYGYPYATLCSMRIQDIGPQSSNDILNELQRAIHSKRYDFLCKNQKANGEIVDVEVFSGPLQLDNKTLLFSIVYDVSDRVAAYDALKNSENRFRLLVEGAPDAIFIQTAGKFAFLNQAALKLFAAEHAGELLGTPVMDRFHPDYQAAIRERIMLLNTEKQSVPPMEEIFLRMDGSHVYVDMTAVPLNYKGQDGAIVFARDISERKAFEMKKMELDAQIRQQQKLEAIGTLAGGVAHEINNPINGIMNYAQLILDDVDDGSAPAAYAGEIINETQRVSVIVKSLLQFSRQEKQSHSYASIYDIINQTMSLINTIIKRDQIMLDIALDEHLPDIKCRSQQIQQVLMNLLTNARDALNEKYPEYDMNKIIRIRCSAFLADSRRWIKLTIEDHGNGISADARNKIFEPFFSTKPKELGTGLGLSISFGIVKDHHGRIEVETEEGQYTRFSVVLPVDNGWKL